MLALKAIRSPKLVVDTTGWNSGKIPKAAFPLSHVKSHHKLGRGWQWTVHTVTDEHRTYRVLVAFEQGKQQYWAWLGAEFGDDQAVIARVEFHATHDGWHCHWKTGAVHEVPRGAVKAVFPIERRRGCKGEPIGVTKADACGIAFRLFNVTAGPEAGKML